MTILARFTVFYFYFSFCFSFYIAPSVCHSHAVVEKDRNSEANTSGKMFPQFGATAETLSKASTMVFRIGTDAHLYDDPEDVNIAQLLDSKFDSEKCEALKRLLALIAQGCDVSNFFPQVLALRDLLCFLSFVFFFWLWDLVLGFCLVAQKRKEILNYFRIQLEL